MSASIVLRQVDLPQQVRPLLSLHDDQLRTLVLDLLKSYTAGLPAQK